VGLYFQNRTQRNVWVAFAYPDERTCGGKGVEYSKKGWYSVAPGAETKVYSGWVGGEAWFFFAEADDQSATWAGDFETPIPDHAFDLCWGIDSSNAKNVGFRRVRPSAEIMDYTVALG
jgi:hypothetical protein